MILQAPSKGDTYDVVVIGTDPEGITAAIASAREGQKTLLVDNRSSVGGLFTLGGLNSFDLNPSPYAKTLLNQGIFDEFYDGIGRTSTFDTILAEQTFMNMIQAEKNIELHLNASHFNVKKVGTHIESLSYTRNGRTYIVQGKQYIDATQNADIAYQAGAFFTYGQQDYHDTLDAMCVTLVFELSGAQWDVMSAHMKEDGNPFTGVDGPSIWGYPEMADYVSETEHVRMRALNIGLQNNGHVLVNALQILGVDGTKESELVRARSAAERELPRIIEHMRTLPGMSDISLVKTMPELYVRETRHLIGEYRLTIDDVLENQDFDDRIAFGSYPVDVQKSSWTTDVVIGNPAAYSIPFRSIVTKQIDNLLVASRSASYDSLAHASARVVPTGMSVGEAAGVASAYANIEKITFHDITSDQSMRHIQNIQQILNENNAQLYPLAAVASPIEQAISYPAMKKLRKMGLVFGGLRNDYQLHERMNVSDQTSLLSNLNRLRQIKGQSALTIDLSGLTHEEVYLTLAPLVDTL